MKTLETLMYAVTFTGGFIFMFCAAGTFLGNDSISSNPYEETALAMIAMKFGYVGLKKKGIIRGLKTPGTRKVFAVVFMLVDVALLTGCVHEAIVNPCERVIIYVGICMVYLICFFEAAGTVKNQK